MYFVRNLVILLFMLYASTVIASGSRVITCNYNFGNDSLMFGVGTLEKSVTIQRTAGNLSYKIFIADISNFNEVDDYIVIENKKGHRITHSLKCK